MKKILAFLTAFILCLSLGNVALAKPQDLTVKDYSTGNTINWIQFKLHQFHPHNILTDEVDTVWISPLQDDEKNELYAAAEAAYPGETVYELGTITMSGYDTQYDYIFDYFGPFTAKVDNPDVHKGDKVVSFIKHGPEEESVEQVKASRVKNGTFSFRDSATDYMEADCVYVILHRDRWHHFGY